jgi:hypothetical protein
VIVVLAIVGTPSPVSYGVFDVLRATVRVTESDCLVVSANSLAEFESALAREPPNSKAIVVSDYPQTDLLSLIRERNVPIIVCVERFEVIAHLSVVARGYTGVDAARHATCSLVNVGDLITARRKDVAVVNHANVSIWKLVAAFGAILGLDIDWSRQMAVVRSLVEEGGEATSIGDYVKRLTPDMSGVRDALNLRSPLEGDLLDALASDYDVIFQRQRLEKLEWPTFALLRPDFPDCLTVGPIDLTGPARCIYYGPYFALPRGRWRATLAIEASDCLSDNQIMIDVTSGDVLAILKATLPSQGVCGCEMQFEIRNPSTPVEIRLHLLTGAIEGCLMLRSIRLDRIAFPDDGDLRSAE